MEPSAAIRLIEKGVHTSTGSSWADLGAGAGIFTIALANRLGIGNTIYAIDQNSSALHEIKTKSDQASVVRVQKNFIADELNLTALDGILMANALHYVNAKEVFVAKLRQMMKADGRLLIVEYERHSANQWVPYPIDFTSLTKLMTASGFSSVEKIGEEPSLYQGTIYSALVR